jgi:hypothetical protein
MDARSARPADPPADEASGPLDPADPAVEFVRFCRRRRRVGWPELYDEMCAVAARRLFQDWGSAELAEHGIAFTLFDMPHLAALTAEVCREERECGQVTHAVDHEGAPDHERAPDRPLAGKGAVAGAGAG